MEEETGFNYSTTLGVGLVILLIIHTINKYTYWKRRGVPQPMPLPVLGNYKDFVLMKKDIGDVENEFYDQYASEPYFGTYMLNNNVLVVKDPDIIKTIMTKDFYFFNTRGTMVDAKQEKLASNLFFNEGDDWKVWRQNLTPLFTSAKMKNMMHLMLERGQQLEVYLETMTKKNEKIDVRALMSDFTLDVIGSCAFGLQMNSMNEESNAFRATGRKIFDISVKNALKTYLRLYFPSIFYGLNLTSFDDKVERFFIELVKQIGDTRKGQKILRNDFIDLLLELKSQGYIEGDSIEKMKNSGHNEKLKIEVTDTLMAAQAFIFFAAGFETSATTTSHALYELAKNRDIQERLRAEIKTKLAENNGVVTYEMMAEMDYLERVIDETLRIHPVLRTLQRGCTSDYKLPDHDLTIKKGTAIHIPLKAIQHDPQYYPKPEVFDPDRFSPEEKARRHPYVYMPFGEGPRICIGLRFGKMQVKLGLIVILNKYDVFRSDSTPDKLTCDPRAFVTSAVGGVSLNLVPLKGQSYFGPKGIEYNMVRVPIGGTDFSTRPYAYNELPVGDAKLNNFSLAMEDLEYKIPVIQKARSLSREEVLVLGAAWSPPPWMKSNNEITGLSRLRPEYYQTYADYHLKFIQQYEQRNIMIWGISTGNEPENGLLPIVHFNSLGWTPSEQTDWIVNNLGPTIKKHADIKILAFDDQRLALPWWIKLMVKRSPRVMDYIDGIGVHWYFDYLPASLISWTHNLYPNKFILATESCEGSQPFQSHVIMGSWKRAENYAYSIIEDLTHYMVGWLDWNIALDEIGGPNWSGNFVDSPIIVMPKNDQFYKQPMFYAMGHFSKFIPRGSVRIDLVQKTSRVDSVAFKRPDGYIVVVLLNRNNAGKYIKIKTNKNTQVVLKLTRKSITTMILNL